ncbi:DUF1760-domain-containing protein [Dissoconium aciculare CBS 342.82]|jgi:hypothetical protein|uniref:DUF1760-domain-containing protein n=1 Tax=Dissoconium aciculare CBS 342.82 TaxID=1314786 RepID=A0A6J3MGZ5_9PEZI|nr:DUF1760-domain-containing protein [Dissoconium aciculare CBS 342.82]KAF1826964.1 DUF1760-domain-containing protein [Dissoconium aciculare CBS 342.82]
MTDKPNPLIDALPPKSDYLTYLTIVEYNLNVENLPTLHDVLQDEALTTNIGWDLVHLLVPLLPESEHCLQDVANLGNPREVILKVTESLRLIDYENIQIPESLADQDDEDDIRARADASSYPLKTSLPVGKSEVPGSEQSQAVEAAPPLPLPINQFIALLSMLPILHRRIKTKYPSRFLSTSLQAVLASFSNASSNREEIVDAIVRMVKTMSGVHRPLLPARRSSNMINTTTSAAAKTGADPEGGESSTPAAEDSAIQNKLFQAFVTHVMEEYMLNLPRQDGVSGMAWCSRIMEKLYPDRQVLRAQSFTDRFHTDESLEKIADAVGNLTALAKDLRISDQDLLEVAITVEKLPAHTGDEEEPPKSAEDIPLSRLGSLLLYAARRSSNVLYDGASRDRASFSLFPDHHELIKNCLASPELGAGQLGTEPEALIDSVLALSLVCLEGDSIGVPNSDDDFNHYLQTIAFLSSNCPDANLRGHAHYITTTVLRSQPNDRVRLDFIRDTLEHCPYENLKVSAVGWIKGETIESNPPSPTPEHDHSERSIFASPYALDSLGAYLFPAIQALGPDAHIGDAWIDFQVNVSFYLASLNFLYLLLTAGHLHQRLDIPDLWSNNDVPGSFLQPLRNLATQFQAELKEGGALASESSGSVLAELQLLDETIQKVTKAASRLSI